MFKEVTMFWNVLLTMVTFFLACSIPFFIGYLILRLFVKPEEKKELLYTCAPYGYEFWYENGRMVRMRNKEGKEWRLNPATDHFEPIIK